jgi:translation initiation factor IF-1
MSDLNKNTPQKVEGIIEETLPSLSFRVKLNDGKEILAYLGGKLRINRIKVLAGDKVLIELSPDGQRGRIIRRL